LPRDDLQARFAQAVARDSEVELHLMVDREARYEAVADAMSAARRAGVARIGFVTQPR
jgi:biopolymer transport protein ExbD